MAPDTDKLKPVLAVLSSDGEAIAPRPPTDGPRPKPIADDPDTWPVTPIGKQGRLSYFLDPLQQLRAETATGLQRAGLIELWGNANGHLETLWPRFGKGGAPNGVDWEAASMAHAKACAARGFFNPTERIRGHGAWRGENDEFIYHCGDTLFVDGKPRAPGVLGAHIYPRADELPHPWPQEVPGGERGAGAAALKLISRWNWRRSIDPILLLGAIGCGFAGGALDWRSMVWFTGPPSTGKSTLQKFLQRTYGNGLVSVTDVTPAGIYQRLGLRSLPVAVDEFEADADGRKAQGTIRLIRQAASGGLVLRGGADHLGQEFVVRSSFFCSSVLIPPLLKQDRSRIAILDLGELTSTAPPDLAPRKMRELGRRLLRRVIDCWQLWPARLEIYRTALGRAGHDARGADLFGTLLAMAELLQFDGDPDHDHVDELAEQVKASAIAELDDDRTDEQRCLDYLLSSPVPPDGPNKKTAGELIQTACNPAVMLEMRAEVQQLLERHGLKILRDRYGKPAQFAVANSHAGLATIFRGTHWAGFSGSTCVWSQSLRRLPGAGRSDQAIRFGGMTLRATFLPVELVLLPADPETLISGEARDE